MLSGYRDGAVGANKKIVRAEAAAIIARELGLSEGAAASFNDVSKSHWASKVIAATNKAGIMGGLCRKYF
ncbi:hypothetical protein DS031_21260 [Bacillus taeanensis]|uniref:SLH domain-containing protein n=1 Tax=Bacillus taeanensis TaxID=273032 RepID=A0A366XUF7_9BACI|nr:hypothetical protein DS031_21260 [Bacillus taeanensis]